MNTKTAPGVALVFASILILAAAPASAHDDGLTCHQHPTSSVWLTGYSIDLLTAWEAVEFGLAVHAFENQAAHALEGRRPGFDRAQYLAARRGLAELVEMAQAVDLLVARAVRAPRPDEQTQRLELARTVFDSLPIRAYLSFDAFLPKQRRGGAIQLPLDRVIEFLQVDFGMPGSLAAILRGAAASC